MIYYPTLSNHNIPIIVDLSGDLYTLRIEYGYTQNQCDDGARDGINIWYIWISL